MRVGFVIDFNKSRWLGGFEYLKNLFYSLRLINSNINPIIIVDDNYNIKDLKELGVKEIYKSKYLRRYGFFRYFHKILIILFGKNFILDKFFEKININIISHSFFTGNNSSVQSIVWFPDFQEVNKYNFISLKKIFFRKLNIYLSSIHSTKIILSSNKAKNDLKKINYKSFKKSTVVQPSFLTIKSKNLFPLRYLKNKFKIEKHFFFLPNHYWIHKNHIIILKALSLFKKNKPLIISTGYFNDDRYPEHKKSIIDFINSNNLQRYYKILGVVSFKEMISMMYHSMSVINPSKSEGWSSTVEQAKSLKKNIVLSKIAVHKEQKPSRSNFFHPNDHYELSRILAGIEKNFIYKKEIKIIKNYEAENVEACRMFAYKYEKLVNSILKMSK
jgi:hypothetical protein